MISINIQGQGSAELQRKLSVALLRTSNPSALLKEVGRRGANELKTHFRGRNRIPNKLGGRRTNYWRRVADSVQNPVLRGTSSVAITVNDATFAQKVFGGTITPKSRKALTIPVDPRAHGRTVGVFTQETGIKLFFLRTKKGGLSGLLAGESGSGINVFYLLAKSVRQKPDPNALPPESDFNSAIADQTERHLARALS